MAKLILVRHGKSIYNSENKFTGWTDVNLAPEGIDEAKNAAELLKKNEITFDICFSSYLKRAIKTAWIILENTGMMYIDCHYSWKLNERHYGQWQEKDKAEIKSRLSEEDYEAVHRGNDVAPPALDAGDKRHPKFDPKYQWVAPELLPAAESLSDTEKRVINYFYEKIVPYLMQNKNALISAHGNSLRALMEHLEHIAPDDIPDLEVPTGTPYFYEFDDQLNLLDHGLIK